MGVTMSNQTSSSARRRLAVLGMLVSVALFSITSAVPATAQASPAPTDSVSSATLTPNGVFGWD
jgi:hypothetical protein